MIRAFATHIAIVVLVIGASSAIASEVQSLPVKVPMTDKNIRLIGRFDVTNPATPRCAWSASTVMVRFHGPAIGVDIDGGWNDRYEIILDGKDAGILKIKGNEHRYRVTTGLSDANHTLELVKRVEPCFGTTTFRGFELPLGGTLLPLPPRPSRKIEVIGDSFSCGYGNDAKSRDEHFSAETENICDTYGAMTARYFGAEFTCLCWSGRNLWNTFTIPELYDFTLADTKSPVCDRTHWTPQVVVIALGGNDLAKKAPPEKQWVDTYDAFISHVRTAYPAATIYLATNPLLTDEKPSQRRTTLTAYLNEVVARRRSEGDSNVHELEFALQNGDRDGFGADWHPSAKSHVVMSHVLESAVERDLGWTPKR